MPKKPYLLLLGIFVTLVYLQIWAATDAHASFCRSREDGLQNADVIFSGKVISIKRIAYHNIVTFDLYDDEVTFEVMSVWKDMSSDQATVTTGVTSRDCGTGDCGYHFKVGERYMVFAYDWAPPTTNPASTSTVQTPVATTRFLMTDICSRTAPLSDAGADLAVLGPGQLPPGGVGPALALANLVRYLLMPFALVLVGLGLLCLARPRTEDRPTHKDPF